MPLSDYFEKFYLQEWQPYTNSFGDDDRRLSDSDELSGLFAQTAGGFVRMLQADNITAGGRFITAAPSSLREGDVIRRDRDGIFLKITGIPIAPPDMAISKPVVMSAEVITAP